MLQVEAGVDAVAYNNPLRCYTRLLVAIRCGVTRSGSTIRTIRIHAGISGNSSQLKPRTRRWA